jgi:hypothetical protein
MANLKILTENSTLDQLADVNAPSPSDGDALVWDSGTSKWVPEAVSAGPGGGLEFGEALIISTVGV